jgi:ParB-like chromosome segregation protein Spo0J
VVGGHQRLKILRELGRTEVDVSVVDLPEDKEKALNLALNKISGDWHMPKLKDLLIEIDTGAFDIEITGFDSDEIENMMKANTPQDIDELLNELDVSKAIEKPIWATVRTSPDKQEILERVLVLLEQNGIKVERSYDT